MPHFHLFRWSVRQAAQEFGMDRSEVCARLEAAGIVADTDGCVTTREMLEALFGTVTTQGQIIDAAFVRQRMLKAAGALAHLRDRLLRLDKGLAGEVEQLITVLTEEDQDTD
jgi:hypothetical protein